MNFEACPHCQRPLEIIQHVESGGRTFPALWYCYSHGAITRLDLNRAVLKTLELSSSS